MIQSMTGFGSAERDVFRVEVRSLNHRYLDINVRMPSLLIEQEMTVRNIIKKRFLRGKIDLFITFSDKKSTKVTINKDFARDVFNAFSELQKDLNIAGSLNIDFFSGYRDLLLIEEPAYNVNDMFAALDEALNKLEEMRKAEGEHLLNELKIHISKIEEIWEEIKELSKNKVFLLKDSLLRRIRELAVELPLDETRVVQEVLFMAQKSDISEELERLKSHIGQFQKSFIEGESIGRKLDFIIQEMNREANTIASKVDDAIIINKTIDLRVEIEKMREQVQNIQ
jgi:uncharacterized protein (TIGR00255 family)